jgi:hypothetical protein
MRSSTTVSSFDKKLLTILPFGNVAIKNKYPIGLLTVEYLNVSESDGHIVIGKQVPGGGTRHLIMGYNSGFSLV